MKFVYINGAYYRHNDALISVNDRAVVFGDALYESITVHEGCVYDYDRHLDRLYAGMQQLKIHPFMKKASLKIPIARLLQQERMKQGLVYIQASRGVYPRNHAIPKYGKGSLFMFCKKMPTFIKGREIRVWLMPDPRSRYCQHKATALLPNILSKQSAIDKGGQEVIYTRDDQIIEGASANVFMVKSGVLYTSPDNGSIVPGVTRQRLIERAKHLGFEVVCEAPKVSWIKTADELFITHASNAISHITHIEGEAIPSNRTISTILFEDYLNNCPRLYQL
ncbi:MAG: hypothetical protein CMM87_05135 [Rickettsiales bacterium]|nr:hypothetical protein [Rickettsiales bacterium]|tara:strand:- start:37840 stop:38676 length:837 start_codon:yes stop_codon:yes gene_type:complete